MLYLIDLNSNDCVPNSYMYDSCTMCYCDEDSNTTVCRMVANCSKTNGGKFSCEHLNFNLWLIH